MKWADTFGPIQSDPPTGDAPALLALAAEVRRLRARDEVWERTTQIQAAFFDHLKNLLAVIHGDGGHYVAQHGLAKACVDAEAKWIKAREFTPATVREKVRELCDGYEVSQSYGVVCDLGNWLDEQEENL